MPTMQEIVRLITLRAKTEGVTQASAELKGMATAEETVSKATLSVTTQVDRLQKSLDPAYRGEVKMAEIEKTLAAARNQGAISIQRENELLTLAAARYRVVGEAATASAEQMKLAKEVGMGLLSGLGAGAVIAGLAELPMKLMEAVHEAAGIGHEAEVIGTTTDKLQELDYAAQHFHVSTETMNSALEKFSKNLGMASTGQGELSKILKANHVTISGDINKDLANYAELIKNARNEEERNLLTTAAFGKGAADLGLLFSDGADGIEKWTAAADNAGAVLGGDALTNAQNLDAEFVTMQAQMDTTFKDFAVTTAPMVIAALQNITQTMRDMKTVIDDLKTGNFGDAALQAAQNALNFILPGAPDVAGQVRRQFPKGMAIDWLGDGQHVSGNQNLITVHGGTPASNDAIERGDHNASLAYARSHANNGGSYTQLPSTPDHAADAQAKAIKSVTDSLKLQTAALTETNRQQYIDQQLSQAKVTDASKEGKAIESLAGTYYDQKAAIDAANQAAQFFGSTITDAFTGIVDGSSDVVTSMLNIAKSIGEAMIQASLLGSGPLAGLMGSTSSNGGPGGLLGPLINAGISALTGGAGGGVHLGYNLNANGGVYASPDLSAYSGQIVSTPTPFRFARGAGLMGEAGPETILPLKRGADGKLGVTSADGGGVTINFNHVGKSDIPDLNAWASKQLPALIKKANRHGARSTI